MHDGRGTGAPADGAADATAETTTPSGRLAAVRAAVARLDADEIAAMRREVAARIDTLEGLRADLAMLVRMRRVIDPALP
jgi:hypothetical protein